MSKPDEYAAPLARAIAVMQEQMAEPENVVKESWLTIPERSLWASFDHHVKRLGEYTFGMGKLEDPTIIRRRAANVANFAWMIAERVLADTEARE